MKLLLVGYRATGKTTAGRMLAERLGTGFVDTDALIQERAGKSIAEIVDESGWDGFRSLERDILSEVLEGSGDKVVSCGGGAVLHEDVFKRMSQEVCPVWLRASVETIVKRIEADSSSDTMRPSLTGHDSLYDEVERVLSQRLHLYTEFSRFVIDTDDRSLEAIVEDLEKIWREVTS